MTPPVSQPTVVRVTRTTVRHDRREPESDETGRVRRHRRTRLSVHLPATAWRRGQRDGHLRLLRHAGRRRADLTWTVAVENGRRRRVLRHVLAHPPAGDGGQARQRVLVSGSARVEQVAPAAAAVRMPQPRAGARAPGPADQGDRRRPGRRRGRRRRSATTSRTAQATASGSSRVGGIDAARRPGELLAAPRPAARRARRGARRRSAGRRSAPGTTNGPDADPRPRASPPGAAGRSRPAGREPSRSGSPAQSRTATVAAGSRRGRRGDARSAPHEPGDLGGPPASPGSAPTATTVTVASARAARRRGASLPYAANTAPRAAAQVRRVDDRSRRAQHLETGSGRRAGRAPGTRPRGGSARPGSRRVSGSSARRVEADLHGGVVAADDAEPRAQRLGHAPHPGTRTDPLAPRLVHRRVPAGPHLVERQRRRPPWGTPPSSIA